MDEENGLLKDEFSFKDLWGNIVICITVDVNCITY